MSTDGGDDRPVAACMWLLADTARQRATLMQRLLDLNPAVIRNLDPHGHHHARWSDGEVVATAALVAEGRTPSLAERWVILVGDLRLLEQMTRVVGRDLEAATTVPAMLEHLAILGRLARRRDDYLAQLNRFLSKASGHLSDQVLVEVRSARKLMVDTERLAGAERSKLERLLQPDMATGGVAA